RRERTVRTNTLLQLADLSQRRVLAACTQQVAQGLERDTLGAAFIEEREGFFVVCGGLRVVSRGIRGCHYLLSSLKETVLQAKERSKACVLRIRMQK